MAFLIELSKDSFLCRAFVGVVKRYFLVKLWSSFERDRTDRRQVRGAETNRQHVITRALVVLQLQIGRQAGFLLFRFDHVFLLLQRRRPLRLCVVVGDLARY